MAELARPFTPEKDDPQLWRRLEDHPQIGDSYPLLNWLHDNDPVADVGHLVFIIGYHNLVRAYFDQRLSRNLGARVEAQAHAGDDDDHILQNSREAFASMLINQDEPDHGRIRRILELV